MGVSSNKQVSFDEEMLILVDENDKEIGYKDKVSCHLGDGILHRAFSIFIFNEKGDLLMQKRSQQKTLWPLYWSNSCCSHPRKGESYQIATRRRLQEELGFTTDLRFLFKFQYQARYKDIGAENELCSIYIGKSNGTVVTNDNEIAHWEFLPIEQLDKKLQENPERFTPWFKMEWDCIRKEYWQEIQQLQAYNPTY